MLEKIRQVLKLIDYPYKAKIIFSIVGSAIVSLIEMFGVVASYPLLLIVTGADINSGIPGKIADFFGVSSRENLIVVTALLVAGCFILKSAVSIIFRWWQLGFVNNLERTARTNLFVAYLDAPFLEHRKRQIPDLHTNLATAVSQSYGQVILGIVSFLSSIFTILLLTLAMFLASPIAALIAILLFAGAGLAIPAILRNKLKTVSFQATEANRVAWYASIPAFQAFRETRLFNVSKKFSDNYYVGSTLQAKVNRKNGFFSELPKYIMEVVFVLGVAVLSTILFSVYTPEQAISVLGIFTVAAMRMMPSVNSAIASSNQVRAGTVGLSILSSEVKEIEKYQRYSEIPTNNTEFSGAIEAKDLRFSYDSTDDSTDLVLKNVSLCVHNGSTVAFVGPSGSGKSTLVDLILGLLVPAGGTISSAGNNINSDIKAWHRQLGVVPQAVVTVPGTLRENIAFGVAPEDIDDELVMEVIRKAELQELVASLPDGIYEDLGQDANRLSGGQKQRLGIARALYRQPKILVLDEATSALDNKTEHRITKTLENLKGQVTTIVVAHRLSTIKNADQIYYLESGEVVDHGTFFELSQKVPDFAELIELGKL